jgi:hypothetical protein
VETCKTNPTLGILWKIAAGLGVPFAALLGEEHAERVRVLRRGDMQPLRSSDGRMESRALMPAGASPAGVSGPIRAPGGGAVPSAPPLRTDQEPFRSHPCVE